MFADRQRRVERKGSIRIRVRWQSRRKRWSSNSRLRGPNSREGLLLQGSQLSQQKRRPKRISPPIFQLVSASCVFINCLNSLGGGSFDVQSFIGIVAGQGQTRQRSIPRAGVEAATLIGAGVVARAGSLLTADVAASRAARSIERNISVASRNAGLALVVQHRTLMPGFCCEAISFNVGIGSWGIAGVGGYRLRRLLRHIRRTLLRQ